MRLFGEASARRRAIIAPGIACSVTVCRQRNAAVISAASRNMQRQICFAIELSHEIFRFDRHATSTASLQRDQRTPTRFSFQKFSIACDRSFHLDRACARIAISARHDGESMPQHPRHRAHVARRIASIPIEVRIVTCVQRQEIDSARRRSHATNIVANAIVFLRRGAND